MTDALTRTASLREDERVTSGSQSACRCTEKLVNRARERSGTSLVHDSQGLGHVRGALSSAGDPPGTGCDRQP
jgi:hypothetical protein